MTQPDPLSADASKQDERFLAVNVNIPLWGNFEKANEVGRQKLVLKQKKAKSYETRAAFTLDWKEAVLDAKRTKSIFKTSEFREEKARLDVQRIKIQQKTGMVDPDIYYQNLNAYNQSKIKTIYAENQHHIAVLRVRRLSSDLLNTYVSKAAWQD